MMAAHVTGVWSPSRLVMLLLLLGLAESHAFALDTGLRKCVVLIPSRRPTMSAQWPSWTSPTEAAPAAASQEDPALAPESLDDSSGATHHAGKSEQHKQPKQPKQPKEPPQALLEPCNIVLTHTNADFDSLAGAVALAKLWSKERPEHPTHVVMPRGVNPLVSRFLAYHKHLLPIRGFATIRAEDVKAIGVVDTQSANRLGPAAAWLAGAEHVAVYDHHSGVAGDINPTELVLEPVGSATTVLVERLQARAIELSETEATLFALGIRADTGALSFTSTTPRDGHALVHMMEQGASQVAIAEFGQARLSATQRDLLATAMHDIERREHNGLNIGAVSLDTGRGFVTGMSAVAEELLQLLSFDVLLLGVTHQNAKAQSFLSLIGRCSARASSVDLNTVMGRFDGGGHPAASAASIRLGLTPAAPDAADATPTEAEAAAEVEAEAKAALDEALQMVVGQVPMQVTAGELMTKTVYSCSPEDSMDGARQSMNKLQKKAIPVIDGEGKLQGMIKFKDVVKAAQTNKGHQLVKAWMRREVVTISADTPLDKVEQVLIETGTGRLPVTDENGVMLGLVTRTDVLRQHRMYGGLARSSRGL